MKRSRLVSLSGSLVLILLLLATLMLMVSCSGNTTSSSATSQPASAPVISVPAQTTNSPGAAPASTTSAPLPTVPANPSTTSSPTTASSQKTIQLSLATIAPNIGAMGSELTWLSDEVAKRTNGAVTIKVYWAGALAGANEMPDALKKGTIDIAHIPWPIYAASIVPLHTISTQCLGYRGSPVAAWMTMEQLVKEFPEFNAELAANNMIRLTYNGNYSQGLIMTKKQVKSIADFKGLKLACTSGLSQTQFKAVGAVPVFMTVQQTLDSTQKGVIDGELTQHGTAVRFKTYEVDKYALLVNKPPLFLADTGFGNLMNLGTWNKLTPDQQKVFTDLRAEYPLKAAEFEKQDVDQSIKTLTSNAVNFTVMPDADNQNWANLVPIDQSREDWVKFAVQNTKLPETKVRQILQRYLDLYNQMEKTYPAIY